MSQSEAEKNAVKKYLQKFDEIRIRLPRGQKDEIKKYAEEHGESMNSLILRALNKLMSDDAGQMEP